MWLLIVLILAIGLRWFFIRGVGAIVMLIFAGDWILPLALVLGGYASVSSFWMLLGVSLIYYVVSCLFLLASFPIMFIAMPAAAIFWRVVRTFSPSGQRTDFQNHLIGSMFSVPVFVALELATLYLVDRWLVGFEMKPLTWDLCAVIFLFNTYNRMASASTKFFGDHDYKGTYYELWTSRRLGDP